MNKYKKMATESKDGNIMITNEEKELIIEGVKLMNSSTNDIG